MKKLFESITKCNIQLKERNRAEDNCNGLEIISVENQFCLNPVLKFIIDDQRCSVVYCLHDLQRWPTRWPQWWPSTCALNIFSFMKFIFHEIYFLAFLALWKANALGVTVTVAHAPIPLHAQFQSFYFTKARFSSQKSKCSGHCCKNFNTPIDFLSRIFHTRSL